MYDWLASVAAASGLTAHDDDCTCGHCADIYLVSESADGPCHTEWCATASEARTVCEERGWVISGSLRAEVNERYAAVTGAAGGNQKWTVTAEHCCGASVAHPCITGTYADPTDDFAEEVEAPSREAAEAAGLALLEARVKAAEPCACHRHLQAGSNAWWNSVTIAAQHAEPIIIAANWMPDEDPLALPRYFVDPSHCPCDCGTGWLSEDGDSWWQNDDAAGEPQGDFDAATIRLVGGPRDGQVVS